MRTHSLHRSLASLLALALLAGVHAESAEAVGFGGFFEYGRDFTGSGGDLAGAVANVIPLSSFDRNEFGVGFSLDTNLARDRLFNYRLDLGFHVVDWANPNLLAAAGTQNGYGFMWNNAFGFGVFRNEHVRLWLGPAGRVNFDYYSNSFTDTLDIVDVQLGVGPEIGFNMHLGRHFTTTLSVAYNYKWGWYAFANSNTFNNDVTISHTDNYVGVNLAFFFRTSGDQFNVDR
jgi:hypothetical protein